MGKLKIILVDDNQIFRESIKDLLVNKFGYNVIAEASDGSEFLELPKNLRADIVLMDLSMPEVDGFKATKRYFWDFPQSKIIAVTNHVEKAYLLKLIEVGFKGCIFKNDIFTELQPAIECVMAGKMWFHDDLEILN